MFPKSPGLGVMETKGGNLDAPWLGLLLSLCLRWGGVQESTSAPSFSGRPTSFWLPLLLSWKLTHIEGGWRDVCIKELPPNTSLSVILPRFFSKPCPMNTSNHLVWWGWIWEVPGKGHISGSAALFAGYLFTVWTSVSQAAGSAKQQPPLFPTLAPCVSQGANRLLVWGLCWLLTETVMHSG